MTRRKEIIGLLQKQEMTLKEISDYFFVSKEEIAEDLKHIYISLGKRFKISPASCKICGFVFKERTKIRKPTKCPRCKKEGITEPKFKVEKYI